MPPKKKTEAEAAAAAPAADTAPKEPKAKKEKVAKEPKEVIEPARRSTRIKDLPPKPDLATLAPAPMKKKKRGDNKSNPDNMEYRPGGASARKSGKKRKKGVAKEDDDEADEEDEKPKKKLKSEAKADDANDIKPDSPPKESANHSITVGSALPDIVLKNEKGDDIQIAELAKETGVVLFAIPKADTAGCNKQACHYRDNYDEIKKHGFDVYALSADSGPAQGKWQSKHNLPYSMLSDPKRVFIEQLGAKHGASTTRSHFVFEKGTGTLLQAQIGVKPDDSHRLALEFIKGL